MFQYDEIKNMVNEEDKISLNSFQEDIYPFSYFFFLLFLTS